MPRINLTNGSYQAQVHRATNRELAREWLEQRRTMGDEATGPEGRAGEGGTLRVASAAPGERIVVDVEFIGIDTRVRGEVTVEFVTSYPGIVALDFGSTALTACLFDDLILAPTNGLSPMQRSWFALELRAQTGNAEWQAFAGDVLAVHGVDAGNAVEYLAAAIQSGVNREAPVLLAELERRARLNHRWRRLLDRIYAAVLRRLALDRLSHHVAALSPSGSRELKSEVAILRQSGGQADRGPLMGEELIARIQAATEGEELDRFRGLKSAVFDPAYQRAGLSEVRDMTRALLGHAVGQIGDFVRRTDHLSSGEIDAIVATYPTVAGPGRRDDYRKLLQEVGISDPDRVILAYDEAVAAAIYHVMNELGADHQLGVEAFRARGDQIMPGRWRQNLLVIDMGGGTTDIVLLQLDLVDRTSELPGDALAGVPRQRLGVAYRLVPEVLGSTGLMHHGGDAVTLALFRLIKAKLAYARAAERADPEFLGYMPTDLPVASLGRLQAEHASQLDRMVSTRWTPLATSPDHNERAARQQRFWKLWDEAERIKLELAAAGPGEEAVDLGPLLSALRRTDSSRTDAADAGSAAGEGPTITRQEFETAAADLLTSIAREAAALAEVGLVATDGVEPVLHQVVLTGRSSGLSQLSTALERELVPSRGPKLVWNPVNLRRFTGDEAKVAVAAGACYARALEVRTFTPDGVASRVAQGKSHLDVDVKNLRFNLPADFVIMGQGTDQVDLFRSRARLYQIDREPRGKRRSHLLTTVAEDFEVRRATYAPGGQPLRWAILDLSDASALGVEAGALIRSNRLRAIVEIDEELELAAYVFVGAPVFVLDEPDDKSGRASRFNSGHLDLSGSISIGDDGIARLDRPIHLEVGTAVDGSGAETIELFGPQPLTGRFRIGSEEAVIHGVEQVLDHRHLRADGVWTLRSVDGKELARVEVPAFEPTLETYYRLALLADGQWFVVMGELPIATTSDRQSLIEGAGAFRMALIPADLRDTERCTDPFDGNQ